MKIFTKFANNLSPINKRRLNNFKANKRGYYSFILLFSLYALSFGAELLFNEKPLLVRYNGETHFPLLFSYSEKDYGGDFNSQANYRDPYVQSLIAEKGFVIFPPFPYSYHTIITSLDVPAPSPPSFANWLGTDDQSRDVLTRLVYGFRLSMSFGLLLSLVALVIGVSAGAVQGYFGGLIDLAFQRFLEIWESIPGLYLLIILSSIIVPNFFSLLLIISLTAWIGYVGVVRAEFLRMRNMEYVKSAETMGLSTAAIMFRHVLPNAIVATVTFLPFNLSAAVTALASLDFLGFGLPPPTPSLGEIIYQGKNNLHAPWLGLTGFFTLAGMLVLLIFSAESLRDAFSHQKTTADKKNIPPQKKTSPTKKEENASKNVGKNKKTNHSHFASNNILEINNLQVSLTSDGRRIQAVNGASLTLPRGKTLALVGESGSGKSMLALSVLRLQAPSLQCQINGNIVFNGQEINTSNALSTAKLRAKEVGIIFQDPLSSLNPVQTIGKQLLESIHEAEKHNAKKNNSSKNSNKSNNLQTQAIKLLKNAELPNPQRILQSYPNELSGGQRQRIMIALALAKQPSLLIADEPTTSLDVTVQAEIISLLMRKQKETGLSILFITHDLGLVFRMAHHVAVMHNGHIIESASSTQLQKNPQHPYSQLLLESSNNLPIRYLSKQTTSAKEKKHAQQIVLQTNNLSVSYTQKKGFFRRNVGEVKAVRNASITLATGKTLGIIGESGSGKSTLANAALRLIKSSGSIKLLGQEMQGKTPKAMRPLRRNMQVVFQDPYSSLSPRQPVETIISEGLRLHMPQQSKIEREENVKNVLSEVGLPQEVAARYPHEFSGGERQRIALARALILRPKLIIFDEPTSSLDVSLQAKILQLILQLQKKYNISYLFISHDIKVIRAIADEIMVMKSGEVVEQGPAKNILTNPQKEYTKQLIKAALL